MPLFKVEHSLKLHQFFVLIAGQDASKTTMRSVLEYRLLPNSSTASKVMEMFHTEVPIEHRGKGVAQELVKEAFKYCLSNNYKVLPTCTYVQKYAREMASVEEKEILISKLTNQ